MSFTHGSIDMETREDPRNHWNLPVDMGTLSYRVAMMYLRVHMQNQRPLVSIHNSGRKKKKKKSCEQVPSTLSQKQPLQITN